MQASPMVEKLLPLMAAWRRALHRMPEEGLKEHKTHAYLMQRLQVLAPDQLDVVAGTGIRCVFMGRGEGTLRTLAFRADIDALHLQENTGLPFASLHEGYMHACGHDGHMAALLGLAYCAAAMRDENMLLCNVVLLFQPAEESCGGAQRMIQAGVLENPRVDEIYGLHMMPDIQLGRYGCCGGPMMAGDYEFDVDVKGRSAHVAMPHRGINALDAANALYARLKALPQQCDPTELALFNIGRMEGGQRRNIVPGTAVLECVVRTYSSDALDDLREKIRRLAEGTARAYDVVVALKDRVYYPAVVNDEALAGEVKRALGDAMAAQKPLLIAEDFSFYQKERPGVFYFVGTGGEGRDEPLHSERFDFDDEALGYALHGHLAVLQRRALAQ